MAATPGTRAAASGDRASLALVALALSPVIAFLVAWLTGYTEPLFANPPSLVGVPLGVVLLFVAAALTALAVVAAIGARRSRGGGAATVALTVPALLLVVLGPAFIAGLMLLG